MLDEGRTVRGQNEVKSYVYAVKKYSLKAMIEKYGGEERVAEETLFLLSLSLSSRPSSVEA